MTTDNPKIADAMEASGEVFEIVSPAEYLERMNGRLKLDVPCVRGEHKVEMRGTVPAEWSLSIPEPRVVS